MSDFGHDPDDVYENISGGDLGTFEQAKDGVESGDADGMGFALSRHDEFLVFEAAGLPTDGDGVRLPDAVEALLNPLGESFTELDSTTPGTAADMVRTIYTGAEDLEVPTGRLSTTIRDDDRPIHVRLYDRGWTPITGQRVSDTPSECLPVDSDGFARVVAVLQKYSE